MNTSLSCLVITYNEELNISRLLRSVQWCSEVLIVDSGSSDRTLDIASEFRNANVIHREFDTFARQCNFGLNLLSAEWVLSLDADYVVTKELQHEICSFFEALKKSTHSLHDAYFIPFRYCINGKVIRSGLLPPRICLYRRSSARYIDIGHAHKVSINGSTGIMKSFLLHDDRKPYSVWLSNQKRYQKIEAVMLLNTSTASLPIQDKLRKHTCLAPFIAFLMCIFLRGGLLDGTEGLIYAFQRLVAESLLFLELNIKE